jgi:hypothetical protein
MEFRRLRIKLRGVALIGNAQNWLRNAAQSLGHFLVERSQTRAGIHDQENQLCLINGGLDLPFDVRRQVVDVLNPDPSGVDQLEESLAGAYECGNAIAGYAGSGLYNCNPLTRQHVEKG